MKSDTQKDNRNLWFFFLLTFIFSWSLWLPFVLSGFKVIKLSDTVLSLMTLAVMFGAFAPLLSAVLLIGLKDGHKGLKHYFREAFSFQIKPVYYILAFILPLLITAISHYIVNFSGIDVLPDNLFPENIAVPIVILIIPYFLFILIAGGGQEEFGWRGYAQQLLQQHFGILGASLILGAVWAVWHLPLWFMPGEGHTYYSFIAFFLYTVSTAVIIGWLYNASGQKLIIAWILHAMGNVAVPFFPILHLEKVPQPGYWVWVASNIIVATALSIWYMSKSKKLIA